MFLDFLPTGQVSNNLNLLEVFFLVNPFYSLKYTGSSYSGRIIVTFVPGGIWYPPENIPFPFPTTVAPLSKISGNAIF